MISPPAQRLAPEAFQSIDNLAIYLDCATKLVLTMFHLFLVLQTIVSSLVELTNLEISGLQEDLCGFIMETMTLSNQGATVRTLVLFWTSVCVLKTIYSLLLDLVIMSLRLKTMYVVVVLYGYLCQWCSEKIYVASDA
jgi:hypothetical protein